MGGLVMNGAANGTQHNDEHPSQSIESQQNGSSMTNKKRRNRRKKKKHQFAVDSNGDVNGGGHDSHTDDAEGSEGGYNKPPDGSDVSSHAVTDIIERPVEQPLTTISEWKDGHDDIPVSMEQLANGAKEPVSDETSERKAIADWLDSQTSHGYANLCGQHRAKIVDHIYHYTHPNDEPTWPSAVRQYVWRAVIRANYWWTNPDTGLTGQRPQAIHRPDGIYENEFRVFLMCAAERADRIGRDIPTAEWVIRVEGEVRAFLAQAEQVGWWELMGLGFSLMFDEEFKTTLSLGDLRERIGRCFKGVKINWKGCEMLKPRVDKGTDENLRRAMEVWEDAKKYF